jgi:hypothetical protein
MLDACLSPRQRAFLLAASEAEMVGSSSCSHRLRENEADWPCEWCVVMLPPASLMEPPSADSAMNVAFEDIQTPQGPKAG